jgi:hypothetical protein
MKEIKYLSFIRSISVATTMFFCEIEIKGGIGCGRKIKVLWRYLYKLFLKFCMVFYIHPNQNSENILNK